MDDKHKGILVLDTGSGMVKVGWAGEDTPRIVVPNILVDISSQAMPAASLQAAGGGDEVGGEGGLDDGVGVGVGVGVGGGSGGDGASGSTSRYLIAGDAMSALQATTATSPVRVTMPVQRGDIVQWDAVELLWAHIFHNELHLENLDEYAVLVAVSPSTSNKARESMTDVLFRRFKFGAVCLYNSAALSLFSTGRTTGVVVEVGEGVTHAVPIFGGFALPHATKRLELAGADLTEQLMSMFSSSDVSFDSSHADIVRDIKEKLCNMTPEGDADAVYELPDGRVINVERRCRTGVPEILFHPSRAVSKKREREHKKLSSPRLGAGKYDDNLDDDDVRGAHGRSMSSSGVGDSGTSPRRGHKRTSSRRTATMTTTIDPAELLESVMHDDMVGVHKLVFQSITACDKLLQHELFQNIVLAGGTSLTPGFADRLRDELEALTGGLHRLDIVQDSQRKHAAWIGGSMLASLPTFHAIKLTAQDYAESDSCVHDKYL